MDVQSAEFRKAHSNIWSQAFSFTGCASLKCAVQLGIADAIDNHGKAMTLSELSDVLLINPSKASYLHRLMRILVNAGFFAEEYLGDGKGGMTNVYGLAPLSRLLLKNEPLNSRGFVLMMFDPLQLQAWNALSEWFQNDDPTAFETAHGKSYWDFMVEEPQRLEMFNETMAADSQLVSKFLLTEYTFLFEGLTSLVDVGGGTGELGRAIAESFPSIKCTVLDLPEVVANLEKTENLDFVGGDMLEKIPPANAIFLKMVLHDWNDEDCVRVLENCKKAIPEKEKGGKVIILDTVILSQIHDSESVKTQVSMDMDMLVLLGTKERSEKDWASLIQKAGFSSYKIFPLLDIRSLIEVYP